MSKWIGVVIVAVSTVSHASPAAEKLFQEGRTLMTDGKLAEACDAFRRSNELEPRVGTLLNLANCEEKRGRIATAWSAFVDARSLAKRQNDDRAGEADKRASALAPRLPYLTIHVPRQPGLVVRRNDAAVPDAELDHDVPVDPGSYRIEASAPGHRSFTRSVDLAAGARAIVDVPALVADGSTSPVAGASPAAPPGPDTPGPAVTETAPHHKASRRFAAGIAIGGTTDDDLIGGLRGVLGLAAVGPGAIRLVPSVFYAYVGDAHLIAIGLAGEYVQPVAGPFFIAAGLGVGLDVIKAPGIEPSTQPWLSFRLSPTFGVGPIDLGVHLQVVLGGGRVIGLGELAADYFF